MDCHVPLWGPSNDGISFLFRYPRSGEIEEQNKPVVTEKISFAFVSF